MIPDGSATERRKGEHIEICLNEPVTGRLVTTGLEKYRFIHQALPEIDFSDIRIDATFLGRRLRAPFLISSMTGGVGEAAHINRRLAELAQARGWAMGVGSLRAALENPALTPTFEVRRYAPDIPVLANVGAVQLNYGFGPDECRRAVELIQADGLVLHLNSLQEVFQPGGDTNFRGLLARIEAVARVLEVPVGVKEVGWGISAETAERLVEAGAAFIDVAGAGGTSWSEVEKRRCPDPVLRAAADAFADWGLPTAEAVREARERLPAACLIASGGIQSGVDAAKAIALGADLAGFGRSLLRGAVDDPEQLAAQAERLELELRIAMFGIGAAALADLRCSPALRRVAD